jgi:hypothetical protein
LAVPRDKKRLTIQQQYSKPEGVPGNNVGNKSRTVLGIVGGRIKQSEIYSQEKATEEESSVRVTTLTPSKSNCFLWDWGLNLRVSGLQSRESTI